MKAFKKGQDATCLIGFLKKKYSVMKKMLAQFMPMSSFKKHMMEIKYTSERDSYIYSSFLPSYRNYFHLFWGMLKYQLS